MSIPGPILHVRQENESNPLGLHALPFALLFRSLLIFCKVQIGNLCSKNYCSRVNDYVNKFDNLFSMLRMQMQYVGQQVVPNVACWIIAWSQIT